MPDLIDLSTAYAMKRYDEALRLGEGLICHCNEPRELLRIYVYLALSNYKLGNIRSARYYSEQAYQLNISLKLYPLLMLNYLSFRCMLLSNDQQMSDDFAEVSTDLFADDIAIPPEEKATNVCFADVFARYKIMRLYDEGDCENTYASLVDRIEADQLDGYWGYLYLIVTASILLISLSPEYDRKAFAPDMIAAIFARMSQIPNRLKPCGNVFVLAASLIYLFLIAFYPRFNEELDKLDAKFTEIYKTSMQLDKNEQLQLMGQLLTLINVVPEAEWTDHLLTAYPVLGEMFDHSYRAVTIDKPASKGPPSLLFIAGTALTPSGPSASADADVELPAVSCV